MGRGPMADATTNKVDYSAKPYSKRDPFAVPQTPFPNTPMEGKAGQGAPCVLLGAWACVRRPTQDRRILPSTTQQIRLFCP